MQCEICGGYIEVGKRVRVEGAIVTACDRCAGYGEVVAVVRKPKPRLKRGVGKGKEKQVTEEDEIKFEEELIEHYPQVIKSERESLNLKQEELAKKINEPASLIHRIESGRMEPTTEVARKLERVLRIKLIKKVKDMEFKETKAEKGGLTLGDLVVVRDKRHQA